MAKDNDDDHARKLTSIHQPTYDVAMMLLNSIPTLGPALAWFAGGVIPDPGQTARDRFVVELAKKVEAILDREQIQEALQREPAPALLSHAMNIASRSFGAEKLEALRNATLNGVFHTPANVNLTAVVFGILDRLTDSHISILKEIDAKEKAIKQPIRWDQAKWIGVVPKPSSDGMRLPTRTLSFEDSDSFVDEFDIQTNEILLADLASLGLIVERMSTMPPIQEWSTDASQNLPGYAQITHKGRLVLEHISDQAQSTGNDAGQGLPTPM
ncbi:hypothetical protein [Mesorhizobium sp. M4B.F.Ca.ET.013.02.1.1]|uniref:hypothetical protein n=1 Tax=Mesorhizobium sp. M4B.F.Ca.ET.013.02.1.1 TaxID=2496755 RepID=UPI000FD1B512|nr:hypothetical protein [Mesorhizobium sp. M4B.F.Ca.ET.013.02.1.1]RUW24651.1 hypothetical protein EOA34_14220 [Mesorhizobium sp. M4B.F.Ca.ET.013.02.1.1]